MGEKYRIRCRAPVYIDVLYDDDPNEPDFEVLKVVVDDEALGPVLSIDPSPTDREHFHQICRDLDCADWPAWEFGT